LVRLNRTRSQLIRVGHRLLLLIKPSLKGRREAISLHVRTKRAMSAMHLCGQAHSKGDEASYRWKSSSGSGIGLHPSRSRLSHGPDVPQRMSATKSV
jgi:hypothetical protein